MMFDREIVIDFQQLMKWFPVVTLLGPRQSGKTTLAKSVFPEKPYENLEDLDTQEKAENDPRGFLAQFPEGAILDEIHRAPNLLSYLQGIVDEKNQVGMFILTGSHQLEVHQEITQSLAGRTAILTLFPLSLHELTRAKIDVSIDEAIFRGGYPRLHMEGIDPNIFYRNYFNTYVERDLRQLLAVRNLKQFQLFVKLCAGRIGQLLSYEQLSNEVGVSAPTIREWISILEASYVIFLLHPYHENFGKRVIKSPKIYFVDMGLAAHLLGIQNSQQVSRDPLRGHLVENLLILELFKVRHNHGVDPHLYFFRDLTGHKVDVIYQKGHELIPIEIKASRTFNSDFLKSLKFFQNLAGDRAPKGYLVYTGDPEQKIHSIELVNYKTASAIVNHTKPE